MRMLCGVVGEVGTLLGPNTMGEYLIIRDLVWGRRGQDSVMSSKLGYATAHEIRDITLALATGERDPQSVAEINLKKGMGIK